MPSIDRTRAFLLGGGCLRFFGFFLHFRVCRESKWHCTQLNYVKAWVPPQALFLSMLANHLCRKQTLSHRMQTLVQRNSYGAGYIPWWRRFTLVDSIHAVVQGIDSWSGYWPLVTGSQPWCSTNVILLVQKRYLASLDIGPCTSLGHWFRILTFATGHTTVLDIGPGLLQRL